MAESSCLPIRGFLLHLTHYDPVWFKRKRREHSIDFSLAREIIDTMSAVNMNLLIIDCADGVMYRRHPLLRRSYSVRMKELEKLVHYAGGKNIEVVPKLNFSRSSYHHHNDWMRPYNKLFDTPEYWEKAFELIDELINAVSPKRFFHIGMDEDHDRALTQYVKAIEVLRSGLRKRKLRAIIWNDSTHKNEALVHAEKSLFAEKILPRDVVHALWNYSRVPRAAIKRIGESGSELWGVPGQDASQVREWIRMLKRYNGKGILMTHWVPCCKGNRSSFLNLLNTIGHLYSR